MKYKNRLPMHKNFTTLEVVEFQRKYSVVIYDPPKQTTVKDIAAK